MNTREGNWVGKLDTINEFVNENDGIYFELMYLILAVFYFFAQDKQQRERPDKFGCKQRFEPWPMQCRLSALPVVLSGRLRAGIYVFTLPGTLFLTNSTWTLIYTVFRAVQNFSYGTTFTWLNNWLKLLLLFSLILSHTLFFKARGLMWLNKI